MDTRQRLEELGLREEYDKPRELHSGLESNVFWNIRKLFEYPRWVQLEAVEEIIWEVGKLKPNLLMGIPTGGLQLAQLIGSQFRMLAVSTNFTHIAPEAEPRVILIDDVLTTGETIEEQLQKFSGNKQWGDITYGYFATIVVLVNRSGLDKIKGIPIISGIEADTV